jgi:hypothetical protein
MGMKLGISRYSKYMECGCSKTVLNGIMEDLHMRGREREREREGEEVTGIKRKCTARNFVLNSVSFSLLKSWVTQNFITIKTRIEFSSANIIIITPLKAVYIIL